MKKKMRIFFLSPQLNLNEPVICGIIPFLWFAFSDSLETRPHLYFNLIHRVNAKDAPAAAAAAAAAAALADFISTWIGGVVGEPRVAVSAAAVGWLRVVDVGQVPHPNPTVRA